MLRAKTFLRITAVNIVIVLGHASSFLNFIQILGRFMGNIVHVTIS